MATREELLEKLKTAVIQSQEDKIKGYAQQFLDNGHDALDGIVNGLQAGMDVAGWEVHDLGVDVPVEKFIQEQQRTNSEIVAISAMMTTTMMGMKKAVQIFKEKKLNAAIMLGGAPLTKDVANLFGADEYADSAADAVSEGIRLVSHLQEI
jgi:methanogenic corrinoid protein MtbC1